MKRNQRHVEGSGPIRVAGIIQKDYKLRFIGTQAHVDNAISIMHQYFWETGHDADVESFLESRGQWCEILSVMGDTFKMSVPDWPT